MALLSNFLDTQTIANSAVTAEKMSGGQTGSAPVYGARAFVNFDGTRNASGSADSQFTNRFIRSSGNITNVLKNGVGDYTIFFTMWLQDGNYVDAFGGRREIGAGNQAFRTESGTKTLSSFRIHTSSTSAGGASVDHQEVCVTVFR